MPIYRKQGTRITRNRGRTNDTIYFFMKWQAATPIFPCGEGQGHSPQIQEGKQWITKILA